MSDTPKVSNEAPKTSIQIDKDLHRFLKIKAAQDGKSLLTASNEAIRKYVKPLLQLEPRPLKRRTPAAAAVS